MAIRSQSELLQFIRETPEQLLKAGEENYSARELELLLSQASFRENGVIRGMDYGPLKSRVTLARFEILLTELNVLLPIGPLHGQRVRPNEYPTGRINDPCVERNNSFCNPD
jgi:hypothetical protein